MPYNEDLAKRIRTKLKSRSGIAEKSLFGGIGFLVGGNMACGVHKQDLVVRLSEKDFDRAIKDPNARVFDIGGRPMKGWILVSSGGYASDKSLQDWIKKGIAFARSLPSK
jgi:TfoX/Sxy family transcriptional regulator of competence genes